MRSDSEPDVYNIRVNDCVRIGFQLSVRFTVFVSLKSEFKRTL